MLKTGESKKPIERKGDYVVVKIGRVWWLVDKHADRDLQIPADVNEAG